MGERARPPRTPDEPEAEPRQAAAEPPQQGLSMASLARRPPDARSATLARLSPAAGNAVLARVYADWTPSEIDRDVEEAMKPDAAIKIDLGTASPRDKLVEIRRLNGAGEWKGAGEVWDLVRNGDGGLRPREPGAVRGDARAPGPPDPPPQLRPVLGGLQEGRRGAGQVEPRRQRVLRTRGDEAARHLEDRQP